MIGENLSVLTFHSRSNLQVNPKFVQAEHLSSEPFFEPKCTSAKKLWIFDYTNLLCSLSEVNRPTSKTERTEQVDLRQQRPKSLEWSKPTLNTRSETPMAAGKQFVRKKFDHAPLTVGFLGSERQVCDLISPPSWRAVSELVDGQRR